MKNFMAFLTMIFCIYTYAYIFKEETAILLLFMFMTAFLLSIISILIPLRKLSISFKIPEGEVEKKENLNVDVHIKNNSFLPIPRLDIIFLTASNLKELSSTHLRLSLGPMQAKTVSMGYMSKTRGKVYLGIDTIVVRDYLNFIKMEPLKNIEESDYRKTLLIIPRIYYKDENFNSKGLTEDTGYLDGRFTYIVEPGYELRDFVGGDSLQKIHWKLSAKKGKLMVRKDEYIADLRPCIVVDFILPQKNIIIEENILEAVLATAWGLAKQGKELEVWLFEGSNWNMYYINDRQGVVELQRIFGEYEFMSAKKWIEIERLPISHMKRQNLNLSDREFVVFTGWHDDELSKIMGACRQKKIAIDMVLLEGDEI
ncbi:MAG: DUF58 domain-containing protein [Epulopiscium sp.]|nr:DUF58 domain-containing protein [Candidatus Epulonipiscium sp.]